VSLFLSAPPNRPEPNRTEPNRTEPHRTAPHLTTRQRECFWVKHYAGKVKYTIGGWVERNMDSIPQSFNDTLATSTMQAS